MNQPEGKYSRREFARRAALFSAAAPIVGTTLAKADRLEASDDLQQPQLPPNFPKLSEQSRAEVEARYDAILKLYNDRFTADQKTELRRLSFVAQPSLDRLRAYAVQNGDGPALFLKPVVEREKKPPKSPTVAPAAAAKKP